MAGSRRLLLDTSTFIWAAAGSANLSQPAVEALSDPNAKLFVSVASVWEMQIRHSLGKLPLIDNADATARRYATALNADFVAIELDHVSALYSLPYLHRDPFDRILAGQAIAQGLTLVSPDPTFRLYSVSILW